MQTPRGRRATELGCDAGCEGGRLGGEGHAGQEARARKPQGPRGGGNFILREVETQGTWEQGAVRVIHFRGLLQDIVSHCGASWGSEETRGAEAAVPGLQIEVADGQKHLWVDLLSRQGQVWMRLQPRDRRP